MSRFTIVAVLAGAACSSGKDSGDTAHHEEDLDAIACEHTGEPDMSPAASEDRESAPEVHIADHGHSVAIPDGVAAYVKLAPTEDGEIHVYVDQEVIVTGFWQGDVEGDAPMSMGANTGCADDIPAVYHLDATAGDVYLQLGPTDVGTLWMMALSASGSHEHDE